MVLSCSREGGTLPDSTACPSFSEKAFYPERTFADSLTVPWYAVVRPRYTVHMPHSAERPTDVSVRQFVADSGSVTRGLRQGRTYTLTLNGEPLAKMVPIRRRQAVPKEEALAIFRTAPALDLEDLRTDLDEAVDQELRDPYEGTGR